jgi:hypothetical protein
MYKFDEQASKNEVARPTQIRNSYNNISVTSRISQLLQEYLSYFKDTSVTSRISQLLQEYLSYFKNISVTSRISQLLQYS